MSERESDQRGYMRFRVGPDTTLAAGWLAYIDDSEIAPHMPSESIEYAVTKQTFYMGAAIMMSLMLQVSEMYHATHDDAASAARLHALNREIQELFTVSITDGDDPLRP